MKIAKYSLLVIAVLLLVGTLVTGCGGAPKPPAASIESPSEGYRSASKSVEFKGMAKDATGKGVTKDIVFEWNFGDGQKERGQSVRHTYAAGGSYTVKLTVMTSAQAKETSPKLEAKQTAQITITVNQDPTVTISASTTEGPVPLEVSFTAQAQDPDGSIANYSWDFGDGQTSTDQNPTHRFEQAGEFTVKLTVTDNDGASATTETKIVVKPSEMSALGTIRIVRMVSTKDNRHFFDPAKITIKVGDTVRWVNECEEGVGTCVHSAQAYPDKIPAGARAFDSTLLTEQGLTYEYTFTVPGEYEYFCFPHEVYGMKGKIIVTP